MPDKFDDPAVAEIHAARAAMLEAAGGDISVLMKQVADPPNVNIDFRERVVIGRLLRFDRVKANALRADLILSCCC